MKLEAILQKLGLLQPGKIMYIGGSDVLPAPLKPEQERQAVAALEQGDEAAKQLLIEHNLRLVVYIARRFENTGVNLEDLISIGTIGLIKAVNTFRPDRNIKLATYSSRCIENEILMHIRKIANQKTEVSLDEPINTDWDGNELLLSDVLGTDGDIVMRPLEDDVDHQLLRQALGRLPEREKQIVSMRFGLGGRQEKTQKEVADIMGISQSYISRLEKRISKGSGFMEKEISRATLKRLPTYLAYLKAMPDSSGVNISATALAAGLHMGEVQVRKDLALVSSGGRPKIGYNRAALIADIEQFLGYGNTNDAVLIGAGKLGRALLGYSGFAEYGLNIVAAFDENDAIIGTSKSGKPIMHLSRLGEVCRRDQIKIGIITVPAEQAQSVCDLLISNGILAIWNFAPKHLNVPDHILVQNENMAASLALLCKHLNEQMKAEE